MYSVRTAHAEKIISTEQEARTAHAEEIISAEQEAKATCFADDNFASELFNACIRRSLHGALRKDWKKTGYDAAGKQEVAFMNPNTGERTMRIQDACEKKVVKGVKRMVAKVELRHQHFVECLLENRPVHTTPWEQVTSDLHAGPAEGDTQCLRRQTAHSEQRNPNSGARALAHCKGRASIRGR